MGPAMPGITPPPPLSPSSPSMEPMRRESPWGSRESTERDEEFGAEDDDEPM